MSYVTYYGSGQSPAHVVRDVVVKVPRMSRDVVVKVPHMSRDVVVKVPHMSSVTKKHYLCLLLISSKNANQTLFENQ